MLRSLVLLVLSAILVISADENVDWLTEEKMNVDKCMRENEVIKEQLKILVTDSKDADDKAKCFVACMFKSKGLFKDDGTIDIEKSIKSLPDDDKIREPISKVIMACNTKKADNNCDTAFNAFVCARDQMKKLFE